MKEEKKKGIFSNLFGVNKASCCNVQIVEVSEEGKKEADKEEIEDKGRSPRTSS